MCYISQAPNVYQPAAWPNPHLISWGRHPAQREKYVCKCLCNMNKYINCAAAREPASRRKNIFSHYQNNEKLNQDVGGSLERERCILVTTVPVFHFIPPLWIIRGHTTSPADSLLLESSGFWHWGPGTHKAIQGAFGTMRNNFILL